jgi:HAD superfamily hydrolase (TIGR01450 family)
MTSAARSRGLRGCDAPLFEHSQRILIDLDGVVILDEQPIDGAAEAIEALRAADKQIRFVTNNASRPPEAVAAMLARAGLRVSTEEVVTSAMAAAGLLSGQLPPGSPVLVVGGEGIWAALSDSGLRPVARADEAPVAVVQGFAAEVGWSMLAEAAVALRAGARWVATNLDRTLPSPRGPLPGNGSLVAALETATGRHPESVGKPEPALYDRALDDLRCEAALAVGDRLDTDIAGARAAGIPSLLVLTGVSSPHDLLAAAPGSRPDYIGRDLGALQLPHAAPSVEAAVATAGAARAELRGDGRVRLDGDVDSGPDRLDGLRALCALAWAQEPGDSGLAGYEQALDNLNLDLT